jgi:hypothetical protein
MQLSGDWFRHHTLHETHVLRNSGESAGSAVYCKEEKNGSESEFVPLLT